MNEITTFQNSDFGSIRTLQINGEPYWVAVDVTKILGYKRNDDAIKRHCQYPLKRRVLDINGRMHESYIIPESDLYRLIVHSKLKSAQKFEKWVFEEVLPTIRKTGSYGERTFPANVEEIEELRAEIDDIKAVLRQITSKESVNQAPKTFHTENSIPKTRKAYINYMLTTLEGLLKLDKMNMLSQAYSEMERKAGLFPQRIQKEWIDNHGGRYISVLDAICEDRAASKVMCAILTFNMDLALE